jgi:hypothetical protein
MMVKNTYVVVLDTLPKAGKLNSFTRILYSDINREGAIRLCHPHAVLNLFFHLSEIKK